MEIINLSEQDFDELLASGKTFLVDYWAPWCVYCRRISPAYDKIAQQYGDRLTVAKVNIDEVPTLSHRENIQVIPTLVLYRDGKALGSVTAPESKAAIDAFIREWVGHDV